MMDPGRGTAHRLCFEGFESTLTRSQSVYGRMVTGPVPVPVFSFLPLCPRCQNVSVTPDVSSFTTGCSWPSSAPSTRSFLTSASVAPRRTRSSLTSSPAPSVTLWPLPPSSPLSSWRSAVYPLTGFSATLSGPFSLLPLPPFAILPFVPIPHTLPSDFSGRTHGGQPFALSPAVPFRCPLPSFALSPFYAVPQTLAFVS